MAGWMERAAQLTAQIERQPSDAAAWAELGQVLAQAGELEAAKFALRNALALAPGDGAAREALGRVARLLAAEVGRGIPEALGPWEAVASLGPGRGTRPHFTEHCAWAVPSREAVERIAALVGRDRLLEVGAGRGLWARLIADAGAEVVAVDLKRLAPAWFEVREQSARQAVAEVEAAVLLLCWPHPKSGMASEALQAFRGDTVIYVGESGAGRVTGEDAFFEALRGGWSLAETLAIPTWPGFSDALYVYRRRGGGPAAGGT